MSVPFVDFPSQVRALRGELDAAVARVLDSGWFVLGPENEALERELALRFEAAEAVSVGNGTEAIALALRAVGVGPGDEVVTTPLTAAFTALAVTSLGATPVFADVSAETLTLSPDAAADAITPKTRALLPVHLYGHPADLDPLLALARERGIALVEDACQAHGARYRGRVVGTLGDAGTLSFYPTKNLGAFGDGGAILLGDAALAPRLRRLRNGGQSDRYRHEEAGINSRLDELQAALLRVKLSRLEAWTGRRRELAALYHGELAGAGVTLPTEQAWAEHVYHLFVIRHAERDSLAQRLAQRRIGTLVHYPIPLHLQPAFAGLGGHEGQLPEAERSAREVLSLPLYPELSEDQVREVAAAVRACL